MVKPTKASFVKIDDAILESTIMLMAICMMVNGGMTIDKEWAFTKQINLNIMASSWIIKSMVTVKKFTLWESEESILGSFMMDSEVGEALWNLKTITFMKGNLRAILSMERVKN